MKRRLALAVVWFSALMATTAAHAGWHEFWERVRIDWERMNCWPDPFRQADQEVVVTPLIAMTDAGWRVQNTLSEQFFDSEQGTLTLAGRLKVHWIATQAPQHRRKVYVVRGPDAAITAARVEAVQKYLEQIVSEGTRPQVLLTDVVPVGGSGEYFDAVDRARKSAIPAPKLPEMPSTGSGGGSGGG